MQVRILTDGNIDRASAISAVMDVGGSMLMVEAVMLSLALMWIVLSGKRWKASGWILWILMSTNNV